MPNSNKKHVVVKKRVTATQTRNAHPKTTGSRTSTTRTTHSRKSNTRRGDTHPHQDFYELFVEELQDAYSSESQLVIAIPRFVNAVTNPKLKDALKEHLKETKKQVIRLEKIFRHLGEREDGEFCEGMEGLITEADQVIRRRLSPVVTDAALIAALQKIEHYEIAGYGTLKAFASHLGYDDYRSLLEDSSEEESNANKTLTTLAEGSWFRKGINAEAAEQLIAFAN